MRQNSNKKSSSWARTLVVLLNGSFLTRENVVKQLPFLLFLFLLLVCYIANTHYSEKAIREIDTVNGELIELRSEYITAKSDLMFRTKQSEVAKMIRPSGLSEPKKPPKKITVSK